MATPTAAGELHEAEQARERAVEQSEARAGRLRFLQRDSLPSLGTGPLPDAVELALAEQLRALDTPVVPYYDAEQSRVQPDESFVRAVESKLESVIEYMWSPVGPGGSLVRVLSDGKWKSRPVVDRLVLRRPRSVVQPVVATAIPPIILKRPWPIKKPVSASAPTPTPAPVLTHVPAFAPVPVHSPAPVPAFMAQALPTRPPSPPTPARASTTIGIPPPVTPASPVVPDVPRKLGRPSNKAKAEKLLASRAAAAAQKLANPLPHRVPAALSTSANAQASTSALPLVASVNSRVRRPQSGKVPLADYSTDSGSEDEDDRRILLPPKAKAAAAAVPRVAPVVKDESTPTTKKYIKTNVVATDDKLECPHPGCDKRFSQRNGLKYHLKHGRCNVPGTESFVEEMKGKPHVCHLPTCGKRYKNRNGLRYHYEHSGAHGAVGMQLFAEDRHPRPEGSGPLEEPLSPGGSSGSYSPPTFPLPKQKAMRKTSTYVKTSREVRAKRAAENPTKKKKRAMLAAAAAAAATGDMKPTVAGSGDPFASLMGLGLANTFMDDLNATPGPSRAPSSTPAPGALASPSQIPSLHLSYVNPPTPETLTVQCVWCPSIYTGPNAKTILRTHCRRKHKKLLARLGWGPKGLGVSDPDEGLDGDGSEADAAGSLVDEDEFRTTASISPAPSSAPSTGLVLAQEGEGAVEGVAVTGATTQVSAPIEGKRKMGQGEGGAIDPEEPSAKRAKVEEDVSLA